MGVLGWESSWSWAGRLPGGLLGSDGRRAPLTILIGKLELPASLAGNFGKCIPLAPQAGFFENLFILTAQTAKNGEQRLAPSHVIFLKTCAPRCRRLKIAKRAPEGLGVKIAWRPELFGRQKMFLLLVPAL